jgi:hypothetical protein
MSNADLNLDLESNCSLHFTLRDLISAGATASLNPTENVPKEPETLSALASLAKEVLEPVTSQFVRPILTYAFSGPANIAKIKRNIAPRVDQHASFERQRNGKRICTFDGAAADFQVRGRASTEVAQYIIEDLDFDAIYFYGKNRPIHVSWSQSPRKLVVEMKFNATHQRHFPVRRTTDRFLELYGR